MADIDDKIAALAFTAPSKRSHGRLVELIGDAAQIARSNGPKVSLSDEESGRIHGIVKNFAGVTLAEFSVTLAPAPDGIVEVSLSIDDYLRTRSTVLVLIPVSPWGAPGYKTIRSFSEYLREKL